MAAQDKPLVSVIVTCFNQELCAASTLESVVAQTYGNWECIAVDDGSTDGTPDVIKALAAKDGRIKPIFKANAGVSAARNQGFASARGKFIQFLDGDDTLVPEKLERQIDHFFSERSIDVSCTNHRHFIVKQNRFETFAFEPIAEYPLKQFLSGWHNGVSLPVHAPLYRRSIWTSDESPYPNDYHGRCEDWVFLVLVAAKGVKFGYLDEVLCTYCINSDGFTGDITKLCTAFIQAALYIDDKLPGELRKGFVENAIQRSLQSYHDARRNEVLYASGNWRLGNLLTKPVVKMLKTLKQFAGMR